MASRAIPSHLKPSSAAGKDEGGFNSQRHHGKSQSHVVSTHAPIPAALQLAAASAHCLPPLSRSAAGPWSSANLPAHLSTSDCGEAILCTLRTQPHFHYTHPLWGTCILSYSQRGYPKQCSLRCYNLFPRSSNGHKFWLRGDSPLSSQSSSPICSHQSHHASHTQACTHPFC
jgi:hypothetical protein